MLTMLKLELTKKSQHMKASVKMYERARPLIISVACSETSTHVPRFAFFLPQLRRNDILQNLIDAEYEELPTTPKTASEQTKITGTLGIQNVLELFSTRSLFVQNDRSTLRLVDDGSSELR